MTRRDEVEATLSTWNGLEAGIQLRTRRELCRTLAAEVDDLLALLQTAAAERNELQRRLDAVLKCVTYTDLEWRTRECSQLSCAYVDVKSELKRRITTIAEGRDNG